jgi:type II secretory pathway component PulC
MININKIKITFLSTLTAASIAAMAVLFNSFFSKPDLYTMGAIEVPKLNINLTNDSKLKSVPEIEKVETTFEYKVIGFIAGENESSVIVKKGNKEQVVVLGSVLDKKYTLISVTRDEIVFQANNNLYKIKNLVGK